jgi:enoyl-CoA hydratase
MSTIEQWGLTEEEAAVNEARRGRAVVDSGETREGAQRFAAGAGRGGTTLA